MTLEDEHATTASLSDAARSVWGKSGDDEGRLSLVQHLLDSASVASWLWENVTPETTKTAIARLSGLSVEGAGSFYCWLAGIHDIGKANRLFQTQLDARPGFLYLSDRLRDAGLPTRPSDDEINLTRLPHALASRVLLETWLRNRGIKPRLAESISAIADAHHGIVSPCELRGPARAILGEYPEAWTDVHAEILDWVAEFTKIAPVLAKITRPLRGPVQNLLTGEVIMADWIASNSDAFPLIEGQETQQRLETGISSVDLTEPWHPAPLAIQSPDDVYRSRFGWPAERRARSMQRTVVDALDATSGPRLVLIEAPTGSGKTEAALVAAELLAADSGAGGVIFAAPTMSTSDALFTRVWEWAQRATSAGEVASLFLGHSKSVLNENYTRFRRFSNINTDEETGGAVVASQWFNGRKKGILANFVVSTVDQVLFMALQSRHSMLRHVGLAGKVVVIDEVHAYSTYSNQYLYTAIRWLSRYGASVILLSATLPQRHKRELLEAYAEQQNVLLPTGLSDAYPLLTVVDSSMVTEREAANDDESVDITIEQCDDSITTLIDVVSTRADEQGCVLVICNTIARAQKTYEALIDRYPDAVELHHSAFVASDRAAKEQRLREAMGPEAHRGSGRPRHRIVVATQVAEQSLDIDADLLITDIAPIDLLIQRMGRLHRHRRPSSDRPEGLRHPQVVVRGILSSREKPVLDSGAMAIYDPKILLATLALLDEQCSTRDFCRPRDVAAAVQGAYQDAPSIPPSWATEWEAASAESARRIHEAQSRSRTYRFPEPTNAGSLDDQFAIRPAEIGSDDGEAAGLAQVRDSLPSLEVIPIIATETGYRPLPWLTDNTDEFTPHAEIERQLAFTLASSTLRLPTRLTRNAAALDACIEELERRTPIGWRTNGFLAGQLALCFDDDMCATVNGHELHYERELGLRTRSGKGEPG